MQLHIPEGGESTGPTDLRSTMSDIDTTTIPGYKAMESRIRQAR